MLIENIDMCISAADAAMEIWKDDEKKCYGLLDSKAILWEIKARIAEVAEFLSKQEVEYLSQCRRNVKIAKDADFTSKKAKIAEVTDFRDKKAMMYKSEIFDAIMNWSDIVANGDDCLNAVVYLKVAQQVAKNWQTIKSNNCEKIDRCNKQNKHTYNEATFNKNISFIMDATKTVRFLGKMREAINGTKKWTICLYGSEELKNEINNLYSQLEAVNHDKANKLAEISKYLIELQKKIDTSMQDGLIKEKDLINSIDVIDTLKKDYIAFSNKQNSIQSEIELAEGLMNKDNKFINDMESFVNMIETGKKCLSKFVMIGKGDILHEFYDILAKKMNNKKILDLYEQVKIIYKKMNEVEIWIRENERGASERMNGLESLKILNVAAIDDII